MIGHQPVGPLILMTVAMSVVTRGTMPMIVNVMAVGVEAGPDPARTHAPVAGDSQEVPTQEAAVEVEGPGLSPSVIQATPRPGAPDTPPLRGPGPGQDPGLGQDPDQGPALIPEAAALAPGVQLGIPALRELTRGWGLFTVAV